MDRESWGIVLGVAAFNVCLVAGMFFALWLFF